ncbi:MAG: pyridoxal phosphate-dependent aminotransferase [Polyangiaceae bacterium]
MSTSRRSSFDLTTNALTRAIEARRASGRGFLDLTVSNPTTADLPYDGDSILRALSDPKALVYDPQPFGLPRAREAVARELSALHPISAEHVLLTASSSEAYSFLFKLLCDPGDEVVIAAPSYPLFEHLAALESVTLVPYPLRYDGEWHVDADALRRAIGPKTRVIVTVNPNNPTGSFLSRDELAMLTSFGLPILSDEVFATYPLTRDPDRATTARLATDALVFALGGLSKLAALPQMKLGWMAVGGPSAKVNDVLAKLEIIADTFLSVGTPVQHAAETLLKAGKTTALAISERTTTNLATLDRALGKDSSATRLRVDGGWYATLRLPQIMTEEEWVLGFLEDDGVLVHPGSFFDFESEAFVIVSLLTREKDFEEGMRRIVAHLAKI